MRCAKQPLNMDAIQSRYHDFLIKILNIYD